MQFLKNNIHFLKQNSGLLFLFIAIIALLSIEAHKEQYKFVITMFFTAVMSSSISLFLYCLKNKKSKKEQNNE